MTELEIRSPHIPYDRYCQATAEILYRMPDHLDLLQSFIWQHLDIAPDFPVLRRFLDFWEKNLDGPIHSVHVTRARLVDPRTVSHAGHLLRLQ